MNHRSERWAKRPIEATPKPEPKYRGTCQCGANFSAETPDAFLSLVETHRCSGGAR